MCRSELRWHCDVKHRSQPIAAAGKSTGAVESGLWSETAGRWREPHLRAFSPAKPRAVRGEAVHGGTPCATCRTHADVSRAISKIHARKPANAASSVRNAR